MSKKIIKILFFLLTIVSVLLVSGIYFYSKNKNIALPPNTPSSRVTSEYNNFLGSWVWHSPDKTANFGFTIFSDPKVANGIKGNYCASFDNGNRADCDPDANDSMKGTFSGDLLTVRFTDSYGGGIGTAIVTYNQDDSLGWNITNIPEGDFYIPLKAKLLRDTQN